MKFVLALCSLIFLIKAFANPIDSVGVERREEGLFVIHEVEEEETIYAIARRYGSSVSEIIKYNKVVENQIKISDTLYVLIEGEKPIERIVKKNLSEGEDVHLVQPGETLYSISKHYSIKLKELRKWNELDDNKIAPGMYLKLKETVPVNKPVADTVSIDSVSTKMGSNSLQTEFEESFANFEKYLVQTGETLYTIAKKIGVSIDSLKLWNRLKTDYIRIGQEIFFKEEIKRKNVTLVEPTQKRWIQIDENGFANVFEEGVASVIQSMETSKFLALHRTLPIGTNLKVRNLMNNHVVHVKVVGKLPDTGLNKNLLLRISRPAYDRLGVLDSKSRVELSYSKE